MGCKDQKATLSMTEDYFVNGYFFEGEDSDGIAIANALMRFASGAIWLDIGCGPMLTVWPIFVPHIPRIIGIDVERANLDFIRDQCARRELTHVHRAAIEYRVSHSDDRPQVDSFWRAVAFDNILSLRNCDARTEQSDLVNAVDFVSQIGCFGCFANKQDVAKALGNVWRYLRRGGKFLSVTWIQDAYCKTRHWNGPVSAELTIDSLRKLFSQANFIVREVSTHRTRDPAYTSIIIIVGQKKSDNVSYAENSG